MAFHTFLQLEGIKGESTDSTHKGWIEIGSYDFTMANPAEVKSGTGGLSAGITVASHFTISKESDIASVDLLFAVAQCQRFKTMAVELCRIEEGKNYPLVRYDFEGVQVAMYHQDGGTATTDRPGESISFAFQQVKWTYTPADGSQKVGPEGWSFTKSEAL